MISHDSYHDSRTQLDLAYKALRRVLQPRELHRKKFCFVGAGVSIDAGLPAWDSLGEHLRDFLSRVEPDRLDGLKTLELGDRFKKSERYTHLQKQEFFDELFISGRKPTAVHRAVVRAGFSAVLTTNYDHLIEDAYALVHRRGIAPYFPADFQNPKLLFPKTFFLGKVHGDAARWNTAVLGHEDYNRAEWAPKAKELIDGNVLLVVGVSGQDTLVSQFLSSLSPATEVHIVLPPSEYGAYQDAPFFSKRAGTYVHVLTYELTAALLKEMGPAQASGALIECSWGERRPVSSRVAFGDDELTLWNFLNGDALIASFQAPPGRGLSMLHARAAELASECGNLVVRMEGKRWLPLEVYTSHLLESLPTQAYDQYRTKRREAVEDWTFQTEGEAIGTAIAALSRINLTQPDKTDGCPLSTIWPRAVVVIVEHADRLPRDAELLLASLIEHAAGHVKVILGVSDIAQAKPTTMDVTWLLRRARGRNYEVTPLTCELCRSVLAEQDIAMPDAWADICTKVNASALHVAAAALSSGADAEKLRDQLLSGHTADVCSQALGVLEREPSSALTTKITPSELLKCAANFSTPRTIEALVACTGAAAAEVRLAANRLVEFGLLQARRGSERYSMPSTLRHALLQLPGWLRAETQLDIARWFEGQAQGELRSNIDQRRAMNKALPLIATSLYHYAVAGARNEYIKLLAGVSHQLVRMYHFNAIESWIEMIPERNPKDTDWNCELRLSLITAELARVQASQRAYRDAVEEGRVLLDNHADRVEADTKSTFQWEEAILATMYRTYPVALSLFKTMADEAKTAVWVMRARLRHAQCLISLGFLSKAEAELQSLVQELEVQRTTRPPKFPLSRKVASDSDPALRSMAARHMSTLATVRLLVRGPDDGLFREATDWAETCRVLNEEHGDETGAGIAILKTAQAHFAARNYQETCTRAAKAGAILTVHTNGRWWRMSAYDLEAKALACLGDFERAEKSLTRARELWKFAAVDDRVRAAELDCTDGLIMLGRGQLEDAVRSLSASVENSSDCPPIEHNHRTWKAQALLRVGRWHDARTELEHADSLCTRMEQSA